MHPLKKISKYFYEIPVDFQKNMKVSGIIIASPPLIESCSIEESYKQVANVATMPGILDKSLAMPDIHWGYGFPIGGVAAFEKNTGVVSPGGVGYDINCGVRLLTLPLDYFEVKNRIKELANEIFRLVPSGIGKSGHIKLKGKEMDKVLMLGAEFAVKKGYGFAEDLKFIENEGKLANADPEFVSNKAKKRGKDQLGTLGAGNHFLEIQIIDKIYNDKIAGIFGLFENQVMIMIHTGSRGLGYQVCADYLNVMQKAVNEYKIELPDRQLNCAPINSKYGESYIKAMNCAANFAFANRQCITHFVREAVANILKVGYSRIKILYDVAHNIAKFERHISSTGKSVKVLVHRKGATRAFGPESYGLYDEFKHTGQPVIIPGDMGTHSYVLVGTQRAMQETFGSTCHGAGRVLSRRAAIKAAKGRDIFLELKKKGIFVFTDSYRTLAEEMPDAYKNIDEVVDVVDKAGISKKVVRLKPLCVIKG